MNEKYGEKGLEIDEGILPRKVLTVDEIASTTKNLLNGGDDDTCYVPGDIGELQEDRINERKKLMN